MSGSIGDNRPAEIGGSQYNIESISGQSVAVGPGSQAITYVGWTAEQVSVLIAGLRREDQPKVWDGRLPYLGLTAFRESDTQFFFGRESLVDDLLERVQQANFIVIAGPSGSGKSSVARAGLFNALRRGRLDKSDRWRLSTMQPRGEPLGQLEELISFWQEMRTRHQFIAWQASIFSKWRLKWHWI